MGRSGQYQAKEKPPKQENTKDLNKKEKRKVRAEFNARRSKILAPIEKKIKEIEKDIENAERQLQIDTDALIKASHKQDGAAITRLSKSSKQIQNHIDTLYKDLEDTSEKYDQEKLEFEEEAQQKAIT